MCDNVRVVCMYVHMQVCMYICTLIVFYCIVLYCIVKGMHAASFLYRFTPQREAHNVAYLKLLILHEVADRKLKPTN